MITVILLATAAVTADVDVTATFVKVSKEWQECPVERKRFDCRGAKTKTECRKVCVNEKMLRR